MCQVQHGGEVSPSYITYTDCIAYDSAWGAYAFQTDAGPDLIHHIELVNCSSIGGSTIYGLYFGSIESAYVENFTMSYGGVGIFYTAVGICSEISFADSR